MNPRFIQLCAAGLLALTTGCAGSYTAIRPDKIATYTSSRSVGPVDFAYQFDALRLNGRNKKYVKKEAKKGYHVAAVRLTNNGNREVNFTRDLVLFYGDRAVTPMPSAVAAQDLKQGVAIYLLYLLANVTITKTNISSYGTISQSSTFLPTGPFIAGGNILGASSANGNMRKEFAARDLTNRNIKPGETVYGLVSFREPAVAPLRVEMTAATPAAAVPAPATAPTTAPR